MGLLDGDIAGLFGTVFGAFYLDATLRRVTLVPDGVGGGTTTETTVACKVQRDSVTEAMRTSGYTQNDARFLILRSPTVGALTSDDRLDFGGQTWALFNPESDPASSYWAVRATPV
jgi:hypothetical protein